MTHLKYIAGTLAACLVALTASAGDVYQFRGPDRLGVYDETGLLKAWPESGPPIAWVLEGLGAGVSSVSVVDSKIYVTGMSEDQMGHLYVISMDGKIEKDIPYGPETVEKQSPGTRSTPTIEGNRAYLLSSLGLLCCIDLTAGTKVWEVNILERFVGEKILWDLSESVLIDGDRVICTPGGPDALMAALNKNTGETIWTTKGLKDKASYSSPNIITHNGRRIIVQATGLYIIGVDPETGALLWSFEQKTPYDIHGVTPIYSNGLLYYTAGDGLGGGALEIAPDGNSVTSKWLDTNLDCLHHGVVLVDGYLYGAGFKGDGKLVCVEMATGKHMWTSEEVKLSNVVAADGMLYCYGSPKSGIVSLVKASPTAFERTGEFTLTQGTKQHWAHPTIAHGRLYIRHGDALVAFDVKAK